MINTIKQFQTESEYQAFRYDSSQFTKPNLSIVKQTKQLKSSFYVPDPFNGYEYVDLGLPSGLLWAKCNVGSSADTDFGDYFMWADTEIATNLNCDFPYYEWYDESDENKHMTKYNDVDNFKIIKLTDDIARFYMGGNWRMPTESDVEELIDNTTITWINGYMGSRRNGVLVTGNGNYSDTTMFIPCGGVRHIEKFDGLGHFGYLWLSSLHQSDIQQAMYFSIDSDRITSIGSAQRYMGCNVRGVVRGDT